MGVAALTSDPRFRAPLVVLTALILHLAVLSRVRVAGVMPDIMLLLGIAAGLTGGPSRGAAVGFVAGMALDLFLQTPLGLSALVFTLVGFAVGTLETGILRASWWIPVVTALVASAAGEFLFALIGTMVGETAMISPRLGVIAAIVGVGNAILAPIVVRVVGWSVARAPSKGLFVV